MAAEMMYSHRIGRTCDFVDGLLHGQALRLDASEGKEHRVALGTDGCVFLWLGTAAYEQPPFVVFIDPVMDLDPDLVLESSPWDSGGLAGMNVVGVNLPPDEARSFVDRYSLAPPEHRKYLGSVLDRCFDAPGDYLEGRTPIRCYPGTIRGRQTAVHPAAKTFEARVVGGLDLSDRVISIVLDPACLHGQTLRGTGARIAGFRRLCQAADVRVVQVSGVSRDRLREEIVKEANRILSERGVL